jgi:hypothetical protein
MNQCNDECTSPCNWDYLQLNFIKDNIKKDDTFLDLGSFQGIFLRFLLNFIPPSNITGIEMDIPTFNMLQQQYLPYGVNLLNLAISNKKETIDYFKGCEGGCPNIFGEHINNSFVGPKIGTIQSDTLDNIFLEKHFNFIKIDIEGAETHALEGGVKLLKNTDIIMIECHTESEFPQILKILIEEIGKDVYCLKYFHKKTLNSPFSYQIVAIDRKYQIVNGKIKLKDESN